MALTPAEKQKQYRERMRANNPKKYEEAKLKNAVRYRERKKKCEYMENEKEIRRKQWRNRKNKLQENVTGNRKDTLKKLWKNSKDANSQHLGSCKTSMSILRPNLDIPETVSNIQRNVEDAGSSQTTNIFTSINKAESQPNDLSQSHQNDTPHSQRTLSQVHKGINFMSQNGEDDDTDLLFKSYAKKLKTMTKRRQATVKFEIAKIMLKAELETCDEMQSKLESGQYLEDNMVVIIQPSASSGGSETYDSTYIKSSPPPVFENVDPISPSSPPSS